MIKKEQVALHVRVKFNDNFEPKSLGEKYLVNDDVIYISDNHIFNNEKGDYVRLNGYTKNVYNEIYTNSGYAYLNEIDLEFPIDL